MIISASRRTDIPAFYARWFANRIRSGYCSVPNPFNSKLISCVPLTPDDVDVIVFWTRNPRPLLPYLSELDCRGYRYYFQYTLMTNPPQIDPGSPPAERSIETFRELSDRVGAERVIWRYDPIFLSSITDPEFHADAYQHIADELSGYTMRSVVSIAHIYRKAQKRMRELIEGGVRPMLWDEKILSRLIPSLAKTAHESGMEIQSCATEIDLSPYGIAPGKCVDDGYISRVFGLNLQVKSDSGQRKRCGCVVSKDIGMYDSCLFGCLYCYASADFKRARKNYQMHDPDSSSVIGRYHKGPTL